MMWRGRTFFRSRAGTSAVEFSLVATPLIMMLFAGCEFSRMIWAQEALQDAAIAGARCVGLVETSCGSGTTVNSANAIAYVQAEAQQWGITVPSAGVTVQTSTSCGGVSGFAQVSVTYTFISVVPQLLTLLSAGNSLTATACFPSATTS